MAPIDLPISFMETLAYLHIAVAYEDSAHHKPLVFERFGQFFEEIHDQKFAARVFLGLVSFSVFFAFFSLLGDAVAFQIADSRVRSIQQRLQEYGCFQGSVSGVYDDLTQAAVKQFQQANELPVTGTVDSATLRALSPSLTPVRCNDTAQNRTDSGEQVTSLAQGFGTITPVGSGTRNLRLGDSGVEVAVLQQQLQALGYLNRSSTGVFDSETREAVIRFQKDNRVTQSGEIDAETRGLLQRLFPNNLNPRELVLRVGDRGPQVQALQERLVIAGYPVTVNEIFDEKTEQALKQFQSGYGLTNNGIADQTTQALLQQQFFVVVVPKRSDATLSAVRQLFPTAFEAQHRLGDYIHVGAYLQKNIAENRSQSLCDLGLLDARVVYF